MRSEYHARFRGGMGADGIAAALKAAVADEARLAYEAGIATEDELRADCGFDDPHRGDVIDVDSVDITGRELEP